MDHKQEQYDVIIIGSGHNGRPVVDTLKEQGKKALLIELDAQTIATLVQQSLLTQQPSVEMYQQSETDAETNPTYISVQEQKIITPINQTVTYTFHLPQKTQIDTVSIEVDDETEPYNDLSFISRRAQATEEVDDVDSMIVDAEYIEETVENQDEEHDDEELEVVEPELIEENEEDETDSQEEEFLAESLTSKYKANWATNKRRYPAQHKRPFVSFEVEEDAENDPDEEDSLFTPRERENSLRDKLIRRKLVPHTIEDHEEELDDTYSMRFANLKFEKQDEESVSTNWEENMTRIVPSKQAQSEEEPTQERKLEHDSFLHTLLEKPLQSERESRLRKRFMNKQRIENQQGLPSPEKNKQTIAKPTKNNIPAKKIKTSLFTQETKTEVESQDSDVFKPETFAPTNRRRTRTQKKKRILNKNDALFETKPKRNRLKPFTIPPTAKIEEVEPEEELYSFDNPTLQPFMRPTPIHEEEVEEVYEESEPPNMESEFFEDESYENDSPLAQNNDSLKRDDIEFEEPYGYNSWEEFVTPYSTNNRKRQELDQVEKRKIALRGLHNLINNLG